MSTLLTVAQVCKALPSKPSERWLNDFLRKTRTDPQGRPLYRVACRAKLIYLDRLIEALPCPSSLSRPAKVKARTLRSADRTSASLWTRAAELTSDPSLSASFGSSNSPSNAENTRRAKLQLVTGKRTFLSAAKIESGRRHLSERRSSDPHRDGLHARVRHPAVRRRRAQAAPAEGSQGSYRHGLANREDAAGIIQAADIGDERIRPAAALLALYRPASRRGSSAVLVRHGLAERDGMGAQEEGRHCLEHPAPVGPVRAAVALPRGAAPARVSLPSGGKPQAPADACQARLFGPALPHPAPYRLAPSAQSVGMGQLPHFPPHLGDMDAPRRD